MTIVRVDHVAVVFDDGRLESVQDGDEGRARFHTQELQTEAAFRIDGDLGAREVHGGARRGLPVLVDDDAFEERAFRGPFLQFDDEVRDGLLRKRTLIRSHPRGARQQVGLRNRRHARQLERAVRAALRLPGLEPRGIQREREAAEGAHRDVDLDRRVGNPLTRCVDHPAAE